MLSSICGLIVSTAAQPADHITHLQSAIVKVLVDGNENRLLTGSAFFISPAGELLTAWHVIEPAVIQNDSTHYVSFRKIYIQFHNSPEKFEVAIPPVFFNKLYQNAVREDYCLLAPVKPLTHSFTVLSATSLNNAVPGSDMIAAGFPVTANTGLVVTGKLSAFFADSSSVIINSNTGKREPVIRQAALLDMTMNAGMSGGPVLIIGATPAQDRVAGILNFPITPYGHAIDRVQKKFSVENAGNDYDMQTANLTNVVTLFSEIFATSTTHISACTAIDSFLKDILLLKK